MKEYWMFGKNTCKTALANPNRIILEIRVTPHLLDQFKSIFPKGIKCTTISNKELDALLPNALHQGIAIKVKPLERLHIDWILNNSANLETTKNIVIVLDQITDPHNLGAIIRSAAAFNVSAIITSNRNTTPETGVVAKSAAGGLESIPIIEVANIAEAINALKKSNYWVFGMSGSGSENIQIMHGYEKIAIVLGSEGFGMRNLVAKSCDILVKIPISNKMESLNVSNAAAIALYAASLDIISTR